MEMIKELRTAVCIKLKVTTYIKKLEENSDKFDILNHIFDIFMILCLILKKALLSFTQVIIWVIQHMFSCWGYVFIIILFLVFADGIFFIFVLFKSTLKYFKMKCAISKYTAYIHIMFKHAYVVL